MGRTAKRRRRVYRSNGGICRYCGKELTLEQTTVDHVIPESRGGTNADVNLVAACGKCNRKKGARTPVEAGMTVLPPAPPLVAYDNLDRYEHIFLFRRIFGFFRYCCLSTPRSLGSSYVMNVLRNNPGSENP